MAIFPGGGDGNVRYENGVIIDSDGDPITYETVTYAQFMDSGFNVATERTVHVSDVHADRSLQGGSFWRIVPAASVKRKLISEAVCYSTFAAAIAAFPISSYTGLAYRCADVGDYNVRLISNGTRVKPESGVAVLAISPSFGTLASPGTTDDSEAPTGVTGHVYTNIAKLIPAGLFGANDEFDVVCWFRKSGTNAAFTPVVFIGTNNNVSTDSLMYDIQTNTTAIDVEPHARIKFLSSTSAIAKRSNEIEVTIGLASRLADRTAGINLSADMYVNIGVGLKHTNDTVYLVSYTMTWRAV